jgi:DNA helicase II / ATP-dependent DNA helicase PcrA
MKVDLFEQEYKKLNPAQKEAVDTIEGPVMVVAGPGTGKTAVLTLRIANILRKTDTSPDSILALTFTEAAAHNMRERLTRVIGPSAYRVGIFTFHGFCNDIIRRYAAHFPQIIGSSGANIIDQIKIVEELISRGNYDKLKPFARPYYYARAIISTIGKLKRENIDPARLRELIKTEPSERATRNGEFARIYEEYQKSLRAKGFYDYDDMVMEVTRTLARDKELLRSLQEEYQYVLADEHQDANAAQNELLRLLMSYHQNPNIFVVGDEMQAIFRFQGASLENFEGFRREYPEARVIELVGNYRSASAILAAAERLSGRRLSPSKKDLGLVSLSTFAHEREEISFVKSSIEEKLRDGVAPGEIAIIYRDNKDALPMVRALEKSKVSFVIESDQDILEDEDIGKLIALLRGVEDFGNKELLATLLHVDFLALGSLPVYQYLREGKESAEVRATLGRLAAWHRMSRNKNLLECFEIVARESGFLSHLLALPDAAEKMEKLSALFDELKTLVENHKTYRLADFLAYIDLLAEHKVLIKKRGLAREGVHLLTAHRAKGQEFDVVYIIGANEGHWGGRRVLDPLSFSFFGADADIEDEKRLFYVALTRARLEVHISYASTREDGKHLMPSRLVEEIKPELIPSLPNQDLAETYAPRQNFGVPLSDKKYLSKLFEEQGLSVSGLNNFLECPWKYFYINLLRVPVALEPYHLYGTAVHAALGELFDRSLDKKQFLERFAFYLRQTPLGKVEEKRALARGKRALGGWYDTYKKTWGTETLTELAIKGVELDGVRLTGRLDKLEILDKKGAVNVVDYKTGKPKSRNEILGKTKNSNGNLYRQLVFYKILLDRFANGRYKMVSGELDFVEPNERGKYKKERFEIEREEARELEKQVVSVSKQIRILQFWNSRCSDPKCRWCSLHHLGVKPPSGIIGA